MTTRKEKKNARGKYKKIKNEENKEEHKEKGAQKREEER
jgi:hypothetical protein